MAGRLPSNVSKAWIPIKICYSLGAEYQIQFILCVVVVVAICYLIIVVVFFSYSLGCVVFSKYQILLLIIIKDQIFLINLYCCRFF
jgi:hypothetical protein